MTPLRWGQHAPGEPHLEEGAELLDLPAAVVCARCGASDCAGCDDDDESSASASGVVLVVPWERPDQALWARFWSTTRLGVEGTDIFFTSLPDGPLAPALSYAAVAEVVAAGSCVLPFAVVILAGLSVLLPAFTHVLLSEPTGQAAVARVVLVAWAAFAAMLVGVHALHGLALHRMARAPALALAAPRATLRRALRFGLYTAGLDVVACPVGLVWVFSTMGRSGLAVLGDLMFKASNRATAAMLRGFYLLDGAQAERVRRRGMWLSVAAVLLGLCACALLVVAAA